MTKRDPTDRNGWGDPSIIELGRDVRVIVRPTFENDNVVAYEATFIVHERASTVTLETNGQRRSELEKFLRMFGGTNNEW